MPLKHLRSLLLCGLVAGSAIAGAQPGHGDIVWDTWGTPHVFARSVNGMFYGFGYAQCKAHGDLLLHLYAESRGRAAEYFGAEFAKQDKYFAANDVWPRAEKWYAAQTPEMKQRLEAFAAGINAYGKEHPEKLAPEVRQVLPVSALDVMAHWERIMQFQYLAPMTKVQGAGAVTTAALREEAESEERDQNGSNGWAIGPAKSATGHAILLMNPHLNWAKSWMTYFEAQLDAPGVHTYGATQVGLPVLRFAFNDHHGFTNTVNTISNVTLYKLTLSGKGYKYDGKEMPFTTATRTIKIKQKDGSLKAETFEVKSTVHGPVFVREDGSTVALRVAGLDRPMGMQEYWDMNMAKNFTDFQRVLQRLQVPMFNILYADRDGHIGYFFNGTVPVRTHGDYAYWQAPVAGDTSANLWTQFHTWDQLPRLVDPAAGWVMNTNNPPWISGKIPGIDPKKYPAYMSPESLILRAQQSYRLLDEKPKLTFDEVVERKHSTRVLMADRMLPDLIRAIEDDLKNDKSDREDKRIHVRAALSLMKDWSHNDDKDERGALLFETWAEIFAGKSFLGQENYAVKWTPTDPLNTPRGLKDPAAAAEMFKQAMDVASQRYGGFGQPFGGISRFHVGGYNVAGNGGFGSSGIFRVHTWGPTAHGERVPTHGETWVAVIEFGGKTPRAEGLLSYGSSSQPGSKHYGDQTMLLGDKKLRPLWRSRDELKAHTEETMKF